MAFILPNKVDFFPHPFYSDEDGFLAVGDELTVDKMLLAYQFGIFPWSNPEDPILWWFTHPRFVLFPKNLIIKKSMRSYLNQNKFDWTLDTAFERVLDECAYKRKNQEGTWLTDDVKAIFCKLHKLGFAHSVEVWEEKELVGGLYGLSLGKVFYGESMFAKKSNASKFGFIKLVQWLDNNGFELIDCQQETNHLRTFGAELIDEEEFLFRLKRNIFNETLKGPWKKITTKEI